MDEGGADKDGTYGADMGNADPSKADPSKVGLSTGSAEEELADRQAPELYPIGRALRTTYGADNHDSLGSDLTTLMLNLARVEPPPVLPVAASPPAPPVVPPSPLRRMVAWLQFGRRD